MNLGFNWVDLVIMIALGVFAFDAVGRPFLLELLDLVSFILALFFSFRFYNSPGKLMENQFGLPHELSLVIGFMVAWFLTEAIFYLAVRIILPKIPRKISLTGTQFSPIPAMLRGLVFISLILVVLATFPIQPGIKKAVDSSKIGSLLLKNAYQLEQPTKQIFGGISHDSLSFLTVEPKTNESLALGFKTSNFSVDEKTEFEMVDLVNKERTIRGLPALSFDASLRGIAREHSEDMFKRGYFSHYSPEGESVADRAQKAGIDYLVIGENLAYAPSLDLAHQGLMNSPGHRANILSPDYHRIGIGVVDSGTYGMMFTQVFKN